MILIGFDSIEDIADEFVSNHEGYRQDNADENEKAILADLDGATIHFAASTAWQYDGVAFVLYEKDGILYEVNAWHESYYGFNGQWKPEQVVLSELISRVERAKTEKFLFYPLFHGFRDELLAALTQLKAARNAV